MKIYLAGPLFSAAEKDFNTRLAFLLRRIGHEVFVPQEELAHQGSPKAIFLCNLSGIERSDVVVACLDGPDPDSGTSWELGYCFAKKKQTLAFRTDVRLHEGFDRINLMLTEGVDTMLYRPGDMAEDMATRIDYWIERKREIDGKR